MSVPRSHEPIMATIAVYTLKILNEIKRGDNVFPQEWEYLKYASIFELDELLAYLGLGFTPPVKMGEFTKEKSLSELHWQFGQAYEALKAMDIITDAHDIDEKERRMVGAISLFKFIIQKALKELRYPEEERFRKIFEQCRQFQYHLNVAAMHFETPEIKKLIAEA